MIRLEQLIYNVCNLQSWNIFFKFKFKEWAESQTIKFDKTDEKLLAKAVEVGLVGKEDLYLEYLNSIEDETDILCSEPFFAESYFPELIGKNIGEGAWIRIPTEKGFNVYFAKPSRVKIDFARRERELEISLNRLDRPDVTLKEVTKTKELLERMNFISVQRAIGIDPYYVSYRKTKTKKVSVLPHEYEMVNDIDVYTTAVSEHIKLKLYYTADLEDKIFYLQSRGISRAIATRMVASGQGYFEVNLHGLIDEERVANGLKPCNISEKVA